MPQISPKWCPEPKTAPHRPLSDGGYAGDLPQVRVLSPRPQCGSWAAARDRPAGKEKWLRKYAAFTLLVIDEWLLDPPDDHVRSMLLELLERRYDTTSTVFCTQYPKKDWHQRLGSGVHADAIMDRIVHNTIWMETGGTNMREHTANPA